MNWRTLTCAFALGLLAMSGVANAQLSPCFGDITLDRRVDVNDLLAVITTWGPCVSAPPPGPLGTGEEDGGPPPVFYCPADISPIGNPDGRIDVNDLLLVISTWGDCNLPPHGNGQGYVVWCEDFSTGNYNRWSSQYNNDTNPCTVAGFDTANVISRPKSMKSQVICAGGINGVHRGYAGLRFIGDNVLPSFTIPSTAGLDSPYGFVVQFRNYMSCPYLMNAQDQDLWSSMMTVTDDCSNAWHRVITLNLGDNSMRLKPGHVDGVQYMFGAPAFPRDQWNRVTVYTNLYTGQQHVWQNGVKVCWAWFTRPSHSACQFHFGLYCSGANSNITYYEDDMRIIKLTQPLEDLVGEPTFGEMGSACAFNP